MPLKLSAKDTLCNQKLLRTCAQSVSEQASAVMSSESEGSGSAPQSGSRSKTKSRSRSRSGSKSKSSSRLRSGSSTSASLPNKKEEKESQDEESCVLESTAALRASLLQVHDSNEDHGGDGHGKEEGDANKSEEPVDLRLRLPLYKAALAGDWEIAKGYIDSFPDALVSPVTQEGNMFLHVAVQFLWKSQQGSSNNNNKKRLDLVAKVVERMPKEALAVRNRRDGSTALHIAALAGFTPAVKILVQKNEALPLVPNDEGVLPIHRAARMGHRDAYLYLLEATTAVCSPAQPGPFTGTLGSLLVGGLIFAEEYGLALDLVLHYPRLATTFDKLGFPPLVVAAQKSCAFASTQHRNILQRLIYSCVPAMKLETFREKLNRGDLENIVRPGYGSQAQLWFHRFGGSHLISGLWMILEGSVPYVKDLRKSKVAHHQMMLLVKYLCEKTAELDHSDAKKIFMRAIASGVEHGIQEIVEEIARIFPGVVDYTLFKFAVVNRQVNVFKLIHRMSHLRGHLRDSIRFAKYEKRNHIWQLAARSPPPHRLQLISGAALKMQREVQWFKEVERLVGPFEKGQRNSDNKTADMIFAEEHKDLVKEGEKWMKDTATSCSLVAALIATVVFAAALTVPGGNDQSSGRPIFANQTAFIFFIASDALSLFSSTASIIMFLSILTARYKQEDFLVALPRSLIIGLVTLFVSIASMMVAFSATLYLAVHHDHGVWILGPVAALAALPVTLFGFLQFPLLKDVIKSTYGPSIFRDHNSHLPFY